MMYVMRLIALMAMTTSFAQAQDWRTTDWSHKIATQDALKKYRVAMTESLEFYQGGKSKAVLTIGGEPFPALTFWTYQLELGTECTYADFTLTIDDDFSLVLEVEHLNSGVYALRPLGVKVKPYEQISEWDTEFFELAFGVSQRLYLTVVQNCSGYPNQPEKLELSFSLRGASEAIKFVEGG